MTLLNGASPAPIAVNANLFPPAAWLVRFEEAAQLPPARALVEEFLVGRFDGVDHVSQIETHARRVPRLVFVREVGEKIEEARPRRAGAFGQSIKIVLEVVDDAGKVCVLPVLLV